MGGGGKAINVFRLGRGLSDEPKELLNWRLWFAVFSFGIMGAARGVDEVKFRSLLLLNSANRCAGLDFWYESVVEIPKDPG